MELFKYFFKSKYNKLMYCLPIWRNNKQRVHLSCGIILDFENNKIEYENM
mgnify:CR=1 FL=1